MGGVAAGPGPGAEEARAAVRRLVALDAGCGAMAALPAVREAARRLPGPRRLAGSREGNGDRLAALAELYEVIGWILFDAGLPGPAHRANARALALADRCGDRWTARLTLLNSSMLLTRTGRPRAALAAAERAAAGPRPLPPRVASLVLIRRAHAVALLGGERDAVELTDRARTAFLDGVSTRDPHWAWWIDEPELLGHQGWVRARLGHWDRALPQLHAAVAAPGPSYRHLFAAGLLATTAHAGAWTEAARLAAELAPTAARTGSARTVASLAATGRHLRDRAAAPPYAREAAVHLLESLPSRSPWDGSRK
ncbi:DNA-binding protein [Streptomyces sp. NPDC048172]|uniref:DNA-binding protein n=1 Tax=Streptomyces sp. NPDC048172 TaxID=3365505 RepID=UPI003714A0AE